MSTETYGTEITIEELKEHYKTHFLTADQFMNLVEAWHNGRSLPLQSNKLSKWLHTKFSVKRGYKCDCGDPECRRTIYVTKGSTLAQDNIFTCGHFKKQIEELSKIKF